MYNMKSKEFPMNPMKHSDMRKMPKMTSVCNIILVMYIVL
jgi:hypothetical protein